jgi:hypothetical protein
MTVSIQSVLANDSAGLDQLRAAEAEMVARIGNYSEILASVADNFRAAVITGASGDDIATRHLAAERGKEAAEGVLAELRQRIATLQQAQADAEHRAQWDAVIALFESRTPLINEAEDLMQKAASLIRKVIDINREAIRRSDALPTLADDERSRDMWEHSRMMADQTRVLAREGTPLAAAMAQRFFNATGAWAHDLEPWSKVAEKPGRISDLFYYELARVTYGASSVRHAQRAKEQ